GKLPEQGETAASLAAIVPHCPGASTSISSSSEPNREFWYPTRRTQAPGVRALFLLELPVQDTLDAGLALLGPLRLLLRLLPHHVALVPDCRVDCSDRRLEVLLDLGQRALVRAVDGDSPADSI